MHSSLLIIGAGPGGYETALAAASRGIDVTLFEVSHVGGTCLNEGCIPTKAFCKNAEMLSSFKESETFGIDDFTFGFDWQKVLDRKNGIVEQLRSGVIEMLKRAKVNVVEGFARFKDARTVVCNGEEYTADNIIIASGSVSRSLPIPGADLECVMSSTDLLNIDCVPESLTIVGGGVIGMEFASIFNSMGSKVTVIEFMKQILPPFDSDIAKRLKQSLTKKGIKILTSAAVKSIERKDDGEIVATYECKGKEDSVVSSHLLMAVGRAPRLQGLDLEKAGVEYTPKGIVVNDKMQTNVSGIYAIGDCNGRMMLAHVATYQGIAALDTIEGKECSIDFSVVPSAVFTVPECGMVGLTEEQCKTAGMSVRIGTSFFRANGKALTLGEPDGLCKLIFNAETEKLVGAHIMGAQAADLAQQCANFISMGATVVDMRNSIFGHPTVSEVISSALHALK